VFKQENDEEDEFYEDEISEEISNFPAKTVQTEIPKRAKNDEVDEILNQGEDWLSILSKERKKSTKKDKDWAIMVTPMVALPIIFFSGIDGHVKIQRTGSQPGHRISF
jgi:hypothetical protein